KPTKTTSRRLGQCSQNMRPINTGDPIDLPLACSWTERLRRGWRVGGRGWLSGRCILSEPVGVRQPVGHQRKEITMSPLRTRMIEDMTLAGLAVGTQQIYAQAVRRL